MPGVAVLIPIGTLMIPIGTLIETLVGILAETMTRILPSPDGRTAIQTLAISTIASPGVRGRSPSDGRQVAPRTFPGLAVAIAKVPAGQAAADRKVAPIGGTALPAQMASGMRTTGTTLVAIGEQDSPLKEMIAEVGGGMRRVTATARMAIISSPAIEITVVATMDNVADTTAEDSRASRPDTIIQVMAGAGVAIIATPVMSTMKSYAIEAPADISGTADVMDTTPALHTTNTAASMVTLATTDAMDPVNISEPRQAGRVASMDLSAATTASFTVARVTIAGITIGSTTAVALSGTAFQDVAARIFATTTSIRGNIGGESNSQGPANTVPGSLAWQTEKARPGVTPAD